MAERGSQVARTKGNAAATKDRVAEILDASTVVFGKYGYNGGSLSQIAQQLDIGESGILHHFKTKANLLAEVLKHRDSQGIERSKLHGTDGLEFVHSWLAMIEFNIADPGNVELFCIISAEATSPNHPAHEYFKARYQTATKFAIDSFRSLSELGYLREDLNPEILGQSLVALSDGLQVQWLLDRSSGMLEHHKKFFTQVLTEEAAEKIGLSANRKVLS